jgi:hypothetical protein
MNTNPKANIETNGTRIHLMGRGGDVRESGRHLTDEEFTGLLLGSSSASVTAHVDACAQCAEEAQRVSGAIGSFEQMSRSWAEQRVASRPGRAALERPAFSWFARPAALMRPAGWSAVAAAVVLAATLGITHRDTRPLVGAPDGVSAPAQQGPVEAMETGQPAAPTAATLKADNDLLSAINGELNASVAPPASTYGLGTGSEAGAARPAKRVSN